MLLPRAVVVAFCLCLLAPRAVVGEASDGGEGDTGEMDGARRDLLSDWESRVYSQTEHAVGGVTMPKP
jgi:hypothetical protein